ncbi:hypothetical protein QBC43DRAFT_333388 [Cladorrhinum sp. PSN259]|nr:hypothetical protein QBC43DRAFT_333388 [Cladorrhinum sp. PSN259]
MHASEKQANSTIKYEGKVGDSPNPADVFTLNSAEFTKLRLYIHSNSLFPTTPEGFWDKYPFDSFRVSHLQGQEYDLMVVESSTISQHCASFQAHGVNAMVEPCTPSGDVEELKKHMEIICDGNKLPGSTECKQARDKAKTILSGMKDNTKKVGEKWAKILQATDEFKRSTENDETRLKGLVGVLEATLSDSAVDNAYAEQLAELNDVLWGISKQESSVVSQEWIAECAQNVYGKLLQPIPWAIASWALLDERRKLEELTNMYNHALDNGRQLLESADLIQGLWHSINNGANDAEGAQASLTDMMGGMSLIIQRCEVVTKKLEYLEGRIMHEQQGSKHMVVSGVNGMVKALNLILQAARELAKLTLVGESLGDMELTDRCRRPQVLAAHYSGQDVTAMARVCFPRRDSLFIDSTKIAGIDSLPVRKKSLSLVYTIGKSDEKRVFVGDTSQGNKWTLTCRDLSEQPQWVTYAAAHGSDRSSPRFRIWAVIYGMTQIVDRGVYDKLYDALNKNEPIWINNDLFGTDGWQGVTKTAAIVYEVDGNVKSISGIENTKVSWNL